MWNLESIFYTPWCLITTIQVDTKSSLRIGERLEWRHVYKLTTSHSVDGDHLLLHFDKKTLKLCCIYETCELIMAPSYMAHVKVSISAVLSNLSANLRKTRGPWATTLTWMYSYEGYIQPKYCKCCMQEKLTFRLPWQLIKVSSLDLIHMVVRGPLKEHYCKTFVKIPKVR